MKATRLQEEGKPQGRDDALSYKLNCRGKMQATTDRLGALQNPEAFMCERGGTVPDLSFFRFWLICGVPSLGRFENAPETVLGRARKRQKRSGEVA